MSVNTNKSEHKNQDEFLEVVPKIAKIHTSLIPSLIKPILVFISFLAVGYYTLWMSSNYVKRETFESYINKQDELMKSKFDIIQNKLETIINQQIVTSEQFKNLNLILNTQQKSLDSVNERLTFLERNYFNQIKENSNR
jgi:hypothetical protein